MHLRYDFKNKPDLSNFKKQSTHFLKKENCVFSFYLEDFAVKFDVVKNNVISVMPHGDFLPETIWKVTFSIIEINATKDHVRVLNPLTDPKMQDINIISDFFNGSEFSCEKKSIEDTLIFIEFMINCVKKVKKLSALA